MDSKVKKMRLCHAIARELFGEAEIDGMPAYVYFLKKLIFHRFGKESRKELTDDEWSDLSTILRELVNTKRGGAGAPSFHLKNM